MEEVKALNTSLDPLTEETALPGGADLGCGSGKPEVGLVGMPLTGEEVFIGQDLYLMVVPYSR